MKVLLPIFLLLFIQFIPIFLFQERTPLAQFTQLNGTIENTTNDALRMIIPGQNQADSENSLKRF